MKALLILVVILVVLHAEVIPFDNSAVEKIFEKRQPALFLFVGDEAGEAAALQTFRSYDLSSPSVILAVSTKNDGHGLYERLAQYLGVNNEPTPSVLFLSAEAKKYKYEQGDITVESLAEFVIKVNNGQLLQFLKSAPIPESNDQPVKVLVGKSFKEEVLDSSKEVLVKFYAPWCGHCKQLAPHFDEAAKLLANNPNILLAKVDSTENEISGLDIQGYPSVKFWRKDKSAFPIEFNGERTAEGIVQWLKEHTEYAWVETEPVGENEEKAAEEEL